MAINRLQIQNIINAQRRQIKVAGDFGFVKNIAMGMSAVGIIMTAGLWLSLNIPGAMAGVAMAMSFLLQLPAFLGFWFLANTRNEAFANALLRKNEVSTEEAKQIRSAIFTPLKQTLFFTAALLIGASIALGMFVFPVLLAGGIADVHPFTWVVSGIITLCCEYQTYVHTQRIYTFSHQVVAAIAEKDLEENGRSTNLSLEMQALSSDSPGDEESPGAIMHLRNSMESVDDPLLTRKHPEPGRAGTIVFNNSP